MTNSSAIRLVGETAHLNRMYKHICCTNQLSPINSMIVFLMGLEVSY